MGSVRRVVCLCSAFMLLSGSAYAQATLAGVVKDSSGAVLPGVTVEASSPVLIEKARTAISDGTGQYRIESLPPGTYTVSFTLSGFAVVKREAVDVSGSGITTINADMRVGTVSETVTVSETLPTRISALMVVPPAPETPTASRLTTANPESVKVTV